MSFNVQCVFSGLNAYVPHTSKSKMAVVMADARKKDTARDGQELQPHFPLLIVDASFVPGSNLPPGAQVVWHLDRLALRFEADGGTPGGFEVDSRGNSSFSLVPTMAEAAPDFAAIDPRCFSDRESRGLVAARLILDRGRMGAHDFDPDRVPTFRFEGKLGNTSEKTRKMANRAALQLEKVKSFSIIYREMDNLNAEKVLELSARAGETLILNIGNFCDGCLPRRSEEEAVVKDYEDVDFRWYYELCQGRNEIRLSSADSLPIPVIESGGGGPGAIQCMGDTYEPSSEF